MKAIVTAVLLAAVVVCSACEKKSAEGQSCAKTGDCDGELICIAQKCCQAKCGDKKCGDDGCGGSCGECAKGEACEDGRCADPGGEKRWRKACTHAFELAKTEAALKGESKEPTNEELDAAMQSCVEGFKSLPAETADGAAGCMLQKIDLKGIGTCMEEAVKKAAEHR